MERKMKIKFFLFVFFVMLCLPVIAMAQTASYNYARGVNFAQYKTYDWVNIEGAGAPDQALGRDIKRAIDAQLAAKGLTRSTDGAQLYVGYQVSFPREKQIVRYYGSYGPGWPFGCTYGDSYGGCSQGFSYGGSAMSTATSSTIHLGNLVLDIYDSSYKDLVWRGNVSRAISTDQKRHNLEKAMAKLLKNYPAKSKK
jgi:hypothetical protein